LDNHSAPLPPLSRRLSPLKYATRDQILPASRSLNHDMTSGHHSRAIRSQHLRRYHAISKHCLPCIKVTDTALTLHGSSQLVPFGCHGPTSSTIRTKVEYPHLSPAFHSPTFSSPFSRTSFQPLVDYVPRSPQVSSSAFKKSRYLFKFVRSNQFSRLRIPSKHHIPRSNSFRE
jgi:hypothetical protein